jgi:cation diffusion facilitator family transporter
LLGDTIHNLSDVSTSLVVFAGLFISKRPASDRYPYGLERAEDIAGLGLALVIWASVVFTAVESYPKLVSHSPTTHLALWMTGACVGIIGNQLVAWYKRRVGQRIHSATMLADARHSWLDAISSAGALAGLIAVAMGFRLGDPIAGFAITAFIAHVGWEVTHDVVYHLMDGVEVHEVTAARRAAEDAGGVPVPVVRGRWMGRSLRFELEAEYPAGMSIGGADAVSERIRQAVLETSEQISSVAVSPRPLE